MKEMYVLNKLNLGTRYGAVGRELNVNELTL